VRWAYAYEGLGDTAMCPSTEQLEGIVDLNDPCQTGGALPVAGAALPNTLLLPSAQSIASATVGPSAQTWLWIAGGVVVLLVLLGGRR
jgi:hypothetical protein